MDNIEKKLTYYIQVDEIEWKVQFTDIYEDSQQLKYNI